jgi:hypothetical protein
LLNKSCEVIPIHIDIKPESNPTVMTNIGRDKEVVRVGTDKPFLKAVRRFAPKRGTILHGVAHGEYFVSHLKGGVADTARFHCLG